LLAVHMWWLLWAFGLVINFCCCEVRHPGLVALHLAQ
jgi:hypothetical protein